MEKEVNYKLMNEMPDEFREKASELEQEYKEKTGETCLLTMKPNGKEPYANIDGIDLYLYTGDQIPF